MQNLRFAIAADETKLFEIAGRYMEIIDAMSPISIELFDANGGQSDDARDVLSGTYMTEPYSRFSVYSAKAQTLELFVSARGGGTRRQPGNVRVIDEITDALQSASFTPPTAIQAFNATAIVSPAANTRGMIIRQASAAVQSGAGGSANVTFLVAKSLPTSWSVPAQRYIITGVSDNASAMKQAAATMNKMIPAGWGLYAIVEIQTAAAVAANGQVAYELQ